MHAKLFSLRFLLVGAAMVLAVGLSFAIEPPKGGKADSVDLKKVVPEAFGEWSLDPQMALVVASPDVEAKLAKVYQQTLSRTYMNPKGERMMLSIAYTGDIDQQMDVHRPELCYPAQGFDIVAKTQDAKVATPAGELPVKQLVARHGMRVEPITYWITVGDTTATKGWERKLVKLRYGLTGQIPEGMLVRVSSISPQPASAYQHQNEFIKGMLGAIDEKDRKRFVGTL
jgi:EpsI family protein